MWIEIDTLRADALSCYGNARRGEGDLPTSPHLDALARDAVLFERCVSAAPWTVPSIATQFTGRWPWQHGATRLFAPIPDSESTVAERLRAGGWHTAGLSTNFVAKGAQGFAQGFDRWDESLALGHEGATGEAAVERLLALCDELAPRAAGAGQAQVPEGGLFLFGLLFEPHWRYLAHPGRRFGPGFGDDPVPYSGALRGDEDLLDLRRASAQLGPRDLDYLRGRYLSEVAWVDRAVGLLVEGLRARGLYEEAAIVLVSDHGEELLERGWLGHTVSLHDELVRVPLLLKLPALADGSSTSTRVEHAVSSIDLGATVLEIAGLEPAADWESRSLLGCAVRGEVAPREHLYMHVDYVPLRAEAEAQESRAHLWGVVHAPSLTKWVVDRTGEEAGNAPRAACFALQDDPLERSDLAATLDEAQRREWMLLRGLAAEPLRGRPGGESLSDHARR